MRSTGRVANERERFNPETEASTWCARAATEAERCHCERTGLDREDGVRNSGAEYVTAVTCFAPFLARHSEAGLFFRCKRWSVSWGHARRARGCVRCRW